MDEQGIDNYGAEYKRTSHDFSFKFLTQFNCVCNICHGTGAKWKFRYVTRDYQSPRTKKICKTLQAHEHIFWICPKCLQNLTKLTGVIVTLPESARIEPESAQIEQESVQIEQEDVHVEQESAQKENERGR